MGIGGAKTARADASDGESPEAVCSADVELFAIRCRDRVAITVSDSSHQATDQMMSIPQIIIVSYLAGELCELGELVAQEVLVALVEAVSHCRGDAVDEEAGLCDGGLPPEVVPLLFQGRVVISVGVAHGRNELVLKASS